MEFEGMHVLVTGGSRGIGRAICQGFARKGARVALNYRENEAAAQETLESLAGSGHFSIQADLSEANQAKKLLDVAMSKFPKLDILVNNAGITVSHRIDEVDFETWQKAWQKVLATNLLGPANMIYLAAQQMMKSGGGHIINVSSRGAFRGEPEKPAYGASKAGLNALSQSLAQKLAPYGIFVSAVAPGFVETDLAAEVLTGPKGDEIRNQSPLKRVAKPQEVAAAVLFLASKEASFMTGAILDVNGASYLRS